MSFFRRFAWIFAAPQRVYDDIRESRVSWWQPWLMVSLLFVISTWLMLPVQRVLLENNPKLAGENIDAQMKITQIFQMVMAPALVLVGALIAAGISYVLVTLQSKAATFKTYFTLILFADVVAVSGYAATALFLRLHGVDNITSPDDLSTPFSLRVLAPEAGSVLKGLLGSIDFFAIWGLTLVAMGLRRIYGFTMAAAIGCVLPLWFLYAAFAILGEMFGMAG